MADRAECGNNYDLIDHFRPMVIWLMGGWISLIIVTICGPSDQIISDSAKAEIWIAIFIFKQC